MLTYRERGICLECPISILILSFHQSIPIGSLRSLVFVEHPRPEDVVF
jgi:hypothetical protein